MAQSTLSLFKRSNGIWYIAYVVNGRRRWKSTKSTDKSKALQFLRKLDTTITEEKRDPPKKTLHEFLFEFMAFARVSYSTKTCELYSNVGKHLATLVGPGSLKDITPKTWDEYAILRSSHVSATSLNIEQRTLKALMNRAVLWEYLNVSPFAKMKCVKIAEVPPKYFTKEEFGRLLSIVEEEWLREAIIFSVATGIRRGELVSLKWTDIDFARRVMVIQNKEGFRIKGNKTRIVPLSTTALAVLDRQRRQGDCEYVFSLGGRPLPGNWVTELFRWYVRKSGLYDRRLHWHNLRSSFASWLVASGVSLYAVSKLLGHSTVALTQKHYASLAPETMHETVDLIRIGA